MKKRYMAPEMEVTEMVVESMLAASDKVGMGGDYAGGGVGIKEELFDADELLNW